MSALGDARVVLAEVPATTFSTDRLKMALAALVAEIEAAPVVEIPERKGPAHAGPSLTISAQAAERMGCAGKRVRLVGVE